MPERSVDPNIGQVLDGRYRLERQLAVGGMGIVYVAEHEVIRRRVAVKILREDCASDPAIAERFLNEARAAGTLGHPNIVECTDFGRTGDGRPYLVMELLEGSHLAEAVHRDGPFPVRRAAHVARQIATALGVAHASQIIHRDLKPENIFLVRRGNADQASCRRSRSPFTYRAATRRRCLKDGQMPKEGTGSRARRSRTPA